MEFIAVNTDKQALQLKQGTDYNYRSEKKITKGLGAGAQTGGWSDRQQRKVPKRLQTGYAEEQTWSSSPVVWVAEPEQELHR